MGVAAPSAHAAKEPTITVMTRNLYYGADVRPLALAAPGAAFEQAASAAFSEVKGTDPDGRMKLVAKEIADAKPDVVGLREVAKWRTGPTGAAPASHVEFDYLATLMAELKRLRQPYRVVTAKEGLMWKARWEALARFA
jgi:hypothetical protein